jgi:hypothetical protein
MLTKDIYILNLSKKDNGSYYGGHLASSYYSQLLQSMGAYDFEEQHKGIKDFLESKGFTVSKSGHKKGHQYAITKDGVYLSSNGFTQNIKGEIKA